MNVGIRINVNKDNKKENRKQGRRTEIQATSNNNYMTKINRNKFLR